MKEQFLVWILALKRRHRCTLSLPRSPFLEMTLKGGIVALYPNQGHLPDFQKTHNNGRTVSKHSSLTGPCLASSHSLEYISEKSLEVHVLAEFKSYTPPSLRVIRVTQDARTKGQRAKMTYIRTMTHIYSRHQYKVSVPSKKNPVVLRRTNVFKTITIFTAFIRSQFLRVIFRLTLPKSINEKSRSNRRTRANWREEKRLIDKKSRNKRRTDAERATRKAETIDELKRNGRLEQQKQSTD